MGFDLSCSNLESGMSGDTDLFSFNLLSIWLAHCWVCYRLICSF